MDGVKGYNKIDKNITAHGDHMFKSTGGVMYVRLDGRRVDLRSLQFGFHIQHSKSYKNFDENNFSFTNFETWVSKCQSVLKRLHFYTFISIVLGKFETEKKYSAPLASVAVGILGDFSIMFSKFFKPSRCTNLNATYPISIHNQWIDSFIQLWEWNILPHVNPSRGTCCSLLNWYVCTHPRPYWNILHFDWVSVRNEQEFQAGYPELNNQHTWYAENEVIYNKRYAK